MPEGFWFSGIYKGREIRVLVIYGLINDDLIWLEVFPVYALWGRRRAYGSQVFWGDMGLERLPDMGREQRKQIYISNKSEDTSPKENP